MLRENDCRPIECLAFFGGEGVWFLNGGMGTFFVAGDAAADFMKR